MCISAIRSVIVALSDTSALVLYDHSHSNMSNRFNWILNLAVVLICFLAFCQLTQLVILKGSITLHNVIVMVSLSLSNHAPPNHSVTHYSKDKFKSSSRTSSLDATLTHRTFDQPNSTERLLDLNPAGCLCSIVWH